MAAAAAAAASAEVEFRRKMEGAGLSEAFIASFLRCYSDLKSGRTGMISEGEITPVSSLPTWDTLPGEDAIGVEVARKLLRETIVLKLNGGLGTSMGLEKAKSLLQVKPPDSTFLDIMLHQAEALRSRWGVPVKFVFMNSFSTSADTQAYVQAKFPAFFTPGQELEILQNKAPKVDASTLRPVSWPKNPEQEWCPPGHGDLFAALLGSGRLDAWLTQGYKYLFVSNSDNLGATLELKLLHFFATATTPPIPMLMQVCPRGPTHRKGGHVAIAKAGGGLLLREVAQCPKEDEPSFQDISRHRFFNTNSLWLNLPLLKQAVEAQPDHCIPLPLITNAKTVDPRDKTSPKVIQLETAMGAAIASLPGSQAVVVPATHYFPVKTCGDLFALRSDAYVVTSPDFRVQLAAECEGHPPVVSLDEAWYKLVDGLEILVPKGKPMPSLKRCRSLKVVGRAQFEEGVILTGDVEIVNEDPSKTKVIPAGSTISGKLVL